MRILNTLRRKAGLSSLLLFVAALWLLPACVKEMQGSILDDGSSSGSGGNAKKMFVPHPDEITLDKRSGLKVAKNVINITFKRGIDRTSAETVISAVGGKVVGYDTSAGMYQILVPGNSLSDLDLIRQRLLSKYKKVEAASYFFVSIHRDPYYAR